MPRPLLAVTLAWFALASAAQAQAPGTFPTVTLPGSATNAGTCGKCGRDFEWSGGSANAPKRCPHCNTRFGYVENADGSRTNLGVGITSAAGIAKLIVFAVIVFCVVVGGLVKLIGALGSGGSSRPKRKKAKRRRPVEEDDEDDAPPRKSARGQSRADGKPPAKPTPDDGGFEVVGDAPPEPPRRARAKVIPPDGAP